MSWQMRFVVGWITVSVTVTLALVVAQIVATGGLGGSL